MKNFKHVIFLILLTSCSIFQSAKVRSIHKLDRLEFKKEKVYLRFPDLRPDSITGSLDISNPIEKLDTVTQYIDTGSIRLIKEVLKDKCDTTIINQIVNLVKNTKCINDTIEKETPQYTIKVFQDSKGVHVQLLPKDTTLKVVYKIKNNTIKDTSKFYDFSEFWVSVGIVALLLLLLLFILRKNK